MSAPWLNLSEMVRVWAHKNPNKIAFLEKDRKLTFLEMNNRANRLANALLKLGLKKGDKISCLLDNCLEIVELYLACAKTGIILNPINIRLAPPEISYIVNHADSKLLVLSNEFIPGIDSIKDELKNIKNFWIIGNSESPFSSEFYEAVLEQESEEEIRSDVKPEDIWVILYTSGTTGKPKGVLRSHESYVAFYLIDAVDFGFTENDVVLNIMPLYHVNSTFFSFTVTYIGGTVYLHPSRKFDALEILGIIQKVKITFISLIPTHYHLLLSIPEALRSQYDTGSLRKLLCSSAPARRELKLGIMNAFPKVELYEAYGSTEAGIVTVLKPSEQLTKLGSIGRESIGTDIIRILDENGKPVKTGEIGELYSRGPMLFDSYYKDPEKTEKSYKAGFFSAGDMAKKDEDGYYYIVDRKDNMVISGGEHIYPSEVEAVIAQHPKVFDVAVIGIPDEKWGEAVKAVVILKPGESCEEKDIINFCAGRVAGFKKPKSVTFIKPEEMPRTPTGKILHRVLRERFK